MRRHACLLILAGLLATALALPAQASHLVRPCGTISVHSKRYHVRAQGVTCAYARRWTRSFLLRGTHPSTYRCTRVRGGSIPFYCRRGTKSYFVVRA
jgi:hypothetical protein